MCPYTALRTIRHALMVILRHYRERLSRLSHCIVNLCE